MISHQHQCIFIHIPKCAGTSVENALGHFDGHQGREGQDHRSVRMLVPGFQTATFGNMDNLKDYLRKTRDRFRPHANPNNGLQVSRAQFRQYFKFSIVRNPWSRAFSWYNNVMRDPVHQRNYRIPADISFKHFMQTYSGKGMLRPQTYWLMDYSGQIPLDYIGKFETLADDFDTISRHLGLEADSLPHKIAGDSSDYRTAYDTATVDLVARQYAGEIALFDYTFE